MFLLFVVFCTSALVFGQDVASKGLSVSTPIQAVNEFSMKLFKDICQLDTKDVSNCLMSPFSGAITLSILDLCTSSRTLHKLVLKRVFRSKHEEDVDHFRQICKSLIVDLSKGNGNKDNNVELDLTNILITGTLKKINPEFEKRIQNFNGRLARVNMEHKEEAVRSIDRLVKNLTHGQIESIAAKDHIRENSIDDFVLLANILYFNGKWAYPFQKHMTHTAKFGCDQHHVFTDMMHGQFEVRHSSLDTVVWKTTDFRAISLALQYAGGRLSMIIVMPLSESVPEGKPLDTLLQELKDDPRKLELILEETMDAPLVEAKVNIPKFKSASKLPMFQILNNEGFDVKSMELDKILLNSPDSLQVEDIFQQVVLQVDEQGTKAAAATVVRLSYRSLHTVDTINIDRPFFYLVHDAETNLVIFMGKITDPTRK